MQKENASLRSGKITKEMTIEDVISTYPETIEVFSKYGLHCAECYISAYANVEEGALAHRVDLNCLLDDLNRSISHG